MSSPSHSLYPVSPRLGILSKALMSAALGLSASLAVATPTYQCEPLDLSGYSDYESPATINNAGEAAGTTGNGDFPVKWDKQRQAHPLQKEDFAERTYVEDINKDGIVVGSSFIEGPHPEGLTAFKWLPDGTPVRLYKAQGEHTAASGINDLVDIVGWHSDGAGPGPLMPAVWNASGRRTLPSVQPGLDTWAQAINNRRVVIGTGDKQVNGKIVQRAARWSNGRLVELGTLPDMENSSALAINDTGLIVGTSYRPLLSKPVAWVKGEIQALNLGDGQQQFGSAWSVNRRGEIIGHTGGLGPTYWADVNAQPQRIFALISPDKPCLGPQGQWTWLVIANDINARGVMVVTMAWVGPDGGPRPGAFRLVPVKVD